MQNTPLSRNILVNRGSCCGNGCRNCPYIPKHEKGSVDIDDFCCDICGISSITELYEGWTYTSERNNPYAKGTASAGLMVFRKMCESCVKNMKESGLIK
jgi:hypothetical protein